MKLRISLSINIERSQPRHRQGEPEQQFEHRDNDTAIEATYGGDQTLHRMGFTPNASPEEG